MTRKKLTPKKEREGKTVLRKREEWVRMAKKGRRPPSPVHHPSPARKPSPMREVEKTVEEAKRWVEEASQLEEVGQSPSLLPTQQLAQMAAEAGPSVSEEELAKGKLYPTMGGKAPGRSSSKQER